jgi:hypothetical protein
MEKLKHLRKEKERNSEEESATFTSSRPLLGRRT